MSFLRLAWILIKMENLGYITRVCRPASGSDYFEGMEMAVVASVFDIVLR